MLKINEWSVNRRIESLRQMDKMLSEMNVGRRNTRKLETHCRR